MEQAQFAVGAVRTEAATQLAAATSRYAEDLAQNLRDHAREVADTRRAAEQRIRRPIQLLRAEVTRLLDTSAAGTPDADEARLRSDLATLIRTWDADEIHESDAGSESGPDMVSSGLLNLAQGDR